ncbi:uncharacterized protein LOC120440750 [Oreochromis aureus]|uniref:uncharacterized protein LOC120440750 n=1 Tax=Oreochromis aureus TaxID=47969 RepID=UPI001952B57B|nr:uncharacterized protein LOC120440750 [Oreochromis aureus]
MEKSQWDLKHICLRSGRLTRLDDFVVQYQISHTALLKEYEDSKRMLQRKKFRVDKEKWKERRQKKKGRYVTVLRKPFPFRRSTKMVASSMAPSSPVQTGRVEDVTLETPEFQFINAVNHTVYLLDPAPSSSEEEDSKLAARKFSDYLKMRRTRHAKTEWVDIKWKGGVLTYPVQKDGFSCGVLVVMMARAVMKVFPDFPVMKFKTSKEKMAEERKLMALEILQASVFDTNSNCAMCSLTKPPGSGPSMMNWIQYDTCQRWYHEQCLDMTNNDFKKAKEEAWNCLLCC